jgi:hypothetical protein
VRRGDVEPDDLVTEEATVGKSQRVEHQRAHRRLITLAGDHLDQPPRQADPSVVVEELRARRRQLRKPNHPLDIPGQRVIPAARIQKTVAQPARGVPQ